MSSVRGVGFDPIMNYDNRSTCPAAAHGHPWLPQLRRPQSPLSCSYETLSMTYNSTSEALCPKTINGEMECCKA